MTGSTWPRRTRFRPGQIVEDTDPNRWTVATTLPTGPISDTWDQT
jgi:hypothetical protein